MTSCTILPNGLDWTVSTLIYSTFYALHCDDVKHSESCQSCLWDLIVYPHYCIICGVHPSPLFKIKYSSFLLWLIAFLLSGLLDSSLHVSHPCPSTQSWWWYIQEGTKAHKRSQFVVSGKGEYMLRTNVLITVGCNHSLPCLALKIREKKTTTE